MMNILCAEKSPETILVGSMPPPLTGQTIAFQMACEGFEQRKLPYRVINLSGGEHQKVKASFSLRRLKQLLIPFGKALSFWFGSKILYLSVTQNWVGFLRDSVFIILAAMGRQRIVIHVHGGDYNGFYFSLSPFQQYLVRSVLKLVDRILVLGLTLKGMFDFDPSLSTKIKVVYNGLPYGKDTAPSRPKRLPDEGKGRLKLLFLSNLIVDKGYLQVLEALRILVVDREIDAECHFCGSFVLASDLSPYSTPGEAHADFLQRIQESGLSAHAFWHGPVAGTEKLRFLQESHFFLLPTRMSEGQPISIIEALAFGLVVITTTLPSIAELVDGGRVAELTSSHQPEEIVHVVESHLRDPNRFEAMSRASIDRYRKNFTREEHLRRLIPLILE